LGGRNCLEGERERKIKKKRWRIRKTIKGGRGGSGTHFQNIRKKRWVKGFFLRICFRETLLGQSLLTRWWKRGGIKSKPAIWTEKINGKLFLNT